MKLKALLFLILVVYSYQPTYAQYSPGYTERGIISYFTEKAEDRTTASGEKFDNNDLVGCHNKIPFNSKVRVTNLANGKSIIVRINDRGPYAYGRVMDISRAAAEKIGLVASGTAKAEIEVVNGLVPDPSDEDQPDQKAEETPPPVLATSTEKEKEAYQLNQTYSQWGSPKSPQGFAVQMAGFSTVEKAQEFCKELRDSGLDDVDIYIHVMDLKGKNFYKILVGAEEDRKGAVVLSQKVIATSGRKGFVTQHK